MTQERREKEILTTASAVFSQKDYHEVTMEEIAQACEVAKGTLYRYYKSKEDLYCNILTKGLEALYSYLVHEVEKEASPLGKVEAIVSCTLNFFDQNKPFVKVFLKEEVRLREEPGHPCIPVLEKITRFVEHTLEEGREKNAIKKLDVALLAASLTGLVKSCFLSELEALVKLPVRSRAKILTEIFLQGAAASSEDSAGL